MIGMLCGRMPFISLELMSKVCPTSNNISLASPTLISLIPAAQESEVAHDEMKSIPMNLNDN